MINTTNNSKLNYLQLHLINKIYSTTKSIMGSYYSPSHNSPSHNTSTFNKNFGFIDSRKKMRDTIDSEFKTIINSKLTDAFLDYIWENYTNHQTNKLNDSNLDFFEYVDWLNSTSTKINHGTL